MNILALDLATTTGWALRENGLLTWGHEDFAPRRGDSPGMRQLRLARWLAEMAIRPGLTARSPAASPMIELIAFERAHHRGGAATHVCVGMMARVEEFCAEHGIEHVAVTTSELKRFALGKKPKDRSKGAMIRAGQLRVDAIKHLDLHGCGVLTEDEADALWVLWWAEDQVGARR